MNKLDQEFMNVRVQRLQKLNYLHLSTDYFMKISLHSSELICRQMQMK